MVSLGREAGCCWPQATMEAFSAGGAFCDPPKLICLTSPGDSATPSPASPLPLLVVSGGLLACFIVTGHSGTCMFAKETSCLPKSN